MRGFAAPVFLVLAMAAAPQAQPARALDAQRSKITVYVYKQGLFSFLADNHIVDAPIARGSYDASRRSVDVTIDASKMRVLDPGLSADKRATVQSNMLGPRVLDVARYPVISFQSTSIVGNESGPLTVTGNLQLHGQTHSMVIQVKRDGPDFTGSTTVRQSAYGITPIKIAGGTVSVKDDVRVDFDIAAGNP